MVSSLLTLYVAAARAGAGINAATLRFRRPYPEKTPGLTLTSDGAAGHTRARRGAGGPGRRRRGGRGRARLPGAGGRAGRDRQDHPAPGGLPGTGRAGADRPRPRAGAGLRLRHRPPATRPGPRRGRADGRGGRPGRPGVRLGRSRPGRGRRPLRRHARPVLAGRQPGGPAAAGARGGRRALGRRAVAALARPPGRPRRAPAGRAAARGARRPGRARAARRAARGRDPDPAGAARPGRHRRAGPPAARRPARRPAAVGDSADAQLGRDWHVSTGGNPFLLEALATALRDGDQKAEPIAQAVLRRIGPRPEAGRLARALAVLGGPAPLRQAAALAGLDLPVRGPAGRPAARGRRAGARLGARVRPSHRADRRLRVDPAGRAGPGPRRSGPAAGTRRGRRRTPRAAPAAQRAGR